MKRRFLPALILACATAMPVMRLSAADDPAMAPTKPTPVVPLAGGGTATPGTPAAGTPTSVAPTEPVTPPVTPNLTSATDATIAKPDEKKIDDALMSAVEDYWHFAKVGRYDLAQQAGAKVLTSGQSADDVMIALQRVAQDRGDTLDVALLGWEQVESMRDVTTKLYAAVQEARSHQRLNPEFIRENIERLSSTPRGRINGMLALKQTGEVAIPFMVEYLRDPSKKQFHGAIREALVELGRSALNPLVACTEMTVKDQTALITICNVLGAISYPDAAPYLARLVTDKNTVPAVKAAAQAALVRLGNVEASQQNAAQLFLDLAERFYYGNASITADNREKVAFVWFWDEAKGLYKENVPPSIFNEVMSMRASEYTLKLDATKSAAVSLWLAADYKREVNLPDGAADPVHKASPSAHFYGTQLGTQYLNRVLDRSQKDKNGPVALRAIKSLEEIAGQANLFSQEHQPIIDSMNYPDRLVRFEAAIAVGSAFPQKSFNGQDQVVPILAEAIAQTGKPNALVLAKDQDEFNQLVKEIGGAGYGTTGGFKAETAMAGAAQMPAIDVIVIAEDAGDTLIDQTNALLSQSSRMQRVPRVFIVAGKGSAYYAKAVDNRLINATTAKDAAALAPVLQKARERSGVVALDEKIASAYALRATDLLGKLAISHSPVLNLLDALPTLLSSLDDARLDVAKSSAVVLGYIDSKDVQPTLVLKATDDKTPDDVKIASLKALSSNAKFFGNHLDSGQVEALQKLLSASQNQEVKNAAAETHGALNLPSEQAMKSIVDQARVK